MKEEIPLFDWDDKKLISFSYRVGKDIGSATNSEMMRRLKNAINEFNKESSEQSEKMIVLTRWIIGLTITLALGTVIQVGILLAETF